MSAPTNALSAAAGLAPVTLDPGRGTLLAVGVVGSVAYGMATAGSDVDRLGLYVTPTTAWFGLSIPADERGTIVHHGGPEGDVALHEARKYARLALQGNPTAVELMWLPERCMEVVTPEFEALRQIRARLLSRARVADAYLGYATQQLQRLINRGRFGGSDEQRREKHARHIARLIEQGLHALRYGEIKIEVENPDRIRAFGQACVESTEPAVELLAEAKRQFVVVDSPLPDQPDHEALDGWLQAVRWAHLGGRPEWTD
jgi:uncharacterized protein